MTTIFSSTALISKALQAELCSSLLLSVMPSLQMPSSNPCPCPCPPHLTSSFTRRLAAFSVTFSTIIIITILKDHLFDCLPVISFNHHGDLTWSICSPIIVTSALSSSLSPGLWWFLSPTCLLIHWSYHSVTEVLTPLPSSDCSTWESSNSG